MKPQKKKKILALFLCMSMVFSISTAAFAAQVDLGGEESLLAAGPHEGGTTAGQPFDRGTGGSDEFRIPAIITLQNGWLLAAADARWTTSGDGGGLDTMVSISKDNGETWEYSLPIYFPDSAGYAGTDATTAIDPAVVQTADGTIYVMVDMNPTGVTTHPDYIYPGMGTGYINVGGVERLALTADYSNTNTAPAEDDTTTYGYYVGDGDGNGYFAVIDRATGEPTEYVVDENLNIFRLSGDGSPTALTQKQVDNEAVSVQQNALYRDSVLHVYNTGYIWAAYSKDNGETWNQTILNPQIKRDTETGLLVSPGRGTLLSDDTVVVPFYNYYDTAGSYPNTQCASFIWSKDNGVTWHRSPDVSGAVSASSESEIVELADGTLRMFVRSGLNAVAYADAEWDEAAGNYKWVTEVISTGIPSRSGCNVSAIMYSEQIDDKDAILVACPGNTGSRTKGRIFVFLVEDDNSMSLGYTFAVNETAFAYSCLTEQSDGKVGLLWEYAASDITYTTYDIADIAAGGKVGGVRTLTVPLYGTLTTKVAGGFQPEPMPDGSVVSVEITEAAAPAASARLGTDKTFDGSIISLSDCLYTFTGDTTDGWTIQSVKDPTLYLKHVVVAPGYPHSTDPYTYYVETGSVSGLALRVVYNNGNSHLFFRKDASASDAFTFNRTGGKSANTDFLIYRPIVEGELGSEEIPGYVNVATAGDIVSGGSYLIVALADDGNYYALHPSTSTTDKYSHVAKVTLEDPGAQANLGSDETYDGSVISVNDCLYTFTGDTANGWTVQSVKDNTLYLNHVGNAAGFPNSTASRIIYVEAGRIGGVKLRTVDNNSKNSHLYFHIAERAGMTYSFNRQGSVASDGSTDFFLYRPVAEGEAGSTEIPGFVSIASADDIVSGESYLIASKATDGNYYLLHPSTKNDKTTLTTDRYTHVAKVIAVDLSTTVVYTGVKEGTVTFVDQVSGDEYAIRVKPANMVDVTVKVGGQKSIRLGVSTTVNHESDDAIAIADVVKNEVTGTYNSIQGNLGTDETYSGASVSILDALYTFALNDDGMTYAVYGVTADATPVYLGLRSGKAGFPQTDDADLAGAISLPAFAGNGGSFVINSAGGYNGNLYFHQLDSKPLRFDQQGSTTSQIQLEFFLYRLAEEGEESSAALPGYVQVTDAGEVVSGERYLIVHDVDGEYYALYPSASESDYYSHVVKIDPDSEPVSGTVEHTYYSLDITGVSLGTTDIMVGSKIYRITVVPKNCTITLVPNGGTVDTTSITAERELAIGTLPTPTREGYTFKGWYDGEGNEVTSATVVNGDMTLTAQWTENATTTDPDEEPGGSSGGGLGAISVKPTVDTTVTVDETTATVAPEATVDSDGSASVTVEADTVTDAIEAAQSGGEGVTSVTIAPTGTEEASAVTVELPAEAASALAESGLDLVVSTESADMTLSNEAVAALAESGETMAVSATALTDEDGQLTGELAIALAVDGEPISEIPGGVTVTVPCENADPGMVAMLVYEDGTREAIPMSLSEDGTMTFTLPGSATVALVNNATDFEDVPEDAWYKDAVDFVSARGLFGGVSSTAAIFDGDGSTTRAMLATVIHRLENEPEHAYVGVFDDVADGLWYSEAVEWAAANGIVLGYDGSFFPNDPITREQLAVMLWRYAGAPAATSGELDFADASDASDWAVDALIWAQETGVMQGYNNTLTPRGTATRAQVAQMLKNFMERVLK